MCWVIKLGDKCCELLNSCLCNHWVCVQSSTCLQFTVHLRTSVFVFVIVSPPLSRILFALSVQPLPMTHLPVDVAASDVDVDSWCRDVFGSSRVPMARAVALFRKGERDNEEEPERVWVCAPAQRLFAVLFTRDKRSLSFSLAELWFMYCIQRQTSICVRKLPY